ncbi:hypothetical protein CVT26_010165 [Gymnopilus dilepis]|uniref:Uncharacterized protein n=1 Tax=Gymnopilus dilepis TaxID=231916 RepID=A0A409YRX8_9AGAR|nr:hypothetical protein CVT26_010165 [Gymnopilus dilepis]
MPALPSATTGFIPTSTPVLNSDSKVLYSPSDAWNKSANGPDCAQSGSLYLTHGVNASISFNYTGPSVVVNTISSQNGGRFSVVVDGFNTTSEIDTNTASGGNTSLPLCYPLQFPPFVITPPGYETRINHTIELVFIGPSQSTAESTNMSIGQFDSFAIPDLQSVLGKAKRNHGSLVLKVDLTMLCSLIVVLHDFVF